MIPGLAPLLRAAFGGVVATMGILTIYFGLLTLVSDWGFTRAEFARSWPFIVVLATGFGIQVGLYLCLRSAVRAPRTQAMVAVNGASSSSAMLSCVLCCNASFVNLAPALAATGFFTAIGRYQTELFWLAIAANCAGIVFIAVRLRAALAAMRCG